MHIKSLKNTEHKFFSFLTWSRNQKVIGSIHCRSIWIFPKILREKKFLITETVTTMMKSKVRKEKEKKKTAIKIIHRETMYTKLKCLSLWFSTLCSPVSSSNRGKNPGTKIGIMPCNLHFFASRKAGGLYSEQVSREWHFCRLFPCIRSWKRVLFAYLACCCLPYQLWRYCRYLGDGTMPPLHQQGRQHNLEIATCSAAGDLATLRSKKRIDHLLAM